MHRLLAAIGSVAFGLRQLGGSLLALVGLGELAPFFVPLLIAALAAAGVASARDTAVILASRPEIQVTTLDRVAGYEDEDGSVWFRFEALMDETHLATPADLGTFFYLARDLDDAGTGLLVRSSRNDAFIRHRVITGRLVADEAEVASARERLPPLPGGFDVDDARLVEEIASGGDPDEAFVPSELGEEPDGSELLVTGRVVTPISHAACAGPGGCAADDAAWLYYLADPEGGGAIVLRSPHPPDAIPVRLEGLYLRDSYDLGPVLESDWYAGLDARVPTRRAFSAGSRPPIVVHASWTPTIAFGGLAMLLLASQLLGYPFFARGGRPPRARRMPVGERIGVEITGRLPRGRRLLTLERSPGAVERLPVRELAVRMWRYGLLTPELPRREAEERYVAAAAGETDRLVVHERDQSAVVAIERSPGDVGVEVGRLYRLGGSAPAAHVRQGRMNVYLVPRMPEERDRLAAEIRGEAEAWPPAAS